MLQILRYMLCALAILSAPSFAAVIIVTSDELQSGLLPVINASIDPHSYLSKYDYGVTVAAAPVVQDTILVLPLSTVPEPSAVLMVMLGLGMLGMAAHKQTKPF